MVHFLVHMRLEKDEIIKIQNQNFLHNSAKMNTTTMEKNFVDSEVPWQFRAGKVEV